MPKKIVIFGATSDIAKQVARLYAGQGAALHLVARDSERLESLCADLRVRGALQAGATTLDVNELARHKQVIDDIFRELDGIDVVLIAHGTLPDQAACEKDVELTLREIETNAVATISLLAHLAERLEAQGQGTIAAISSVAGDRGRRSNYVYGTAKSAVSTFLQGLRGRFAKTDVHVLTIKPGFVDTAMTAEFEKGPLWASAEDVAAGIVQAIEKRREVVYLPWFWRYIMLIIRIIPETLFKRLSI